MKRPKRVLLLIIVALALFAGLLFLFAPAPAHQPPTAALSWFQPSAEPNLLNRAATRIRFWFRKPESIRFRAEVFAAPKLSQVELGKLFGRAGNAEHEKTVLWFLAPDDAEKLRIFVDNLDAKELIAQPSIVTSDSSAGSFFVGQTIMQGASNVPVGLQLAVKPRLKQNRFHTNLDFLWTEMIQPDSKQAPPSIRTNAAFSAQIESYQGQRMLILSEATDNKRAAFLFISATPLNPAPAKGSGR